jgi:hypothetical protein
MARTKVGRIWRALSKEGEKISDKMFRKMRYQIKIDDKQVKNI